MVLRTTVLSLLPDANAPPILPCPCLSAEWDDYYRMVLSGSTGVAMTEETAAWIVDRHNSWEKRSMDNEAHDEGNAGMHLSVFPFAESAFFKESLICDCLSVV